MHRRIGRRGGVLATLALIVTLVVSMGGAGAQADDSLVIRSVDGRDPDAVVAEFVWTGERAQVTDLVVRENGTVVESTAPIRIDEQESFGIVLAIDTSGSMEANAAFERAIDAARDFVAAKEPTDQVAIVGFGDVVQVVTRFTDDVEQLNEGIGQLGVGGSTALYDAITTSVGLFEGTDLVPNVVLVTDGRDEASQASEAIATGALADANALLFAIGIESDNLDLGVLDRLSSATGGAVLQSADPAGLSAVYADAQSRIRRQFVVTFASEADREGPSSITMTVGATSDEASYSPGARLDSVAQIEPVVLPGNGGIDALQGGFFLWFAVLLVVICVGGTAFAIGASVTPERPTLDRVLQPYSDGFVAPDDGDGDRLATSAILKRAVELTGNFAERRGVLRRIEDLLERANLPLRAAEALFFYLVAVVVLAVLGGLLAGAVAGGVLVFAFALLIPPGVVVYLAGRRRAQFQSQLPDFLQLIASTLRAGYSMMQGVEAAASEVVEPTRRELQRVVSEARLGMPLEEALHNVSARMNSSDFEWAVMAISIQREVGGNLAELLDTVADTMRERDRLRRDIRSLTAEGRVSAAVLGVLPIALGLMIYALNPDYIGSLFEETIGVILSIGAGLLMLGGFAWMYKIIDIEV